MELPILTLKQNIKIMQVPKYPYRVQQPKHNQIYLGSLMGFLSTGPLFKTQSHNQKLRLCQSPLQSEYVQERQKYYYHALYLQMKIQEEKINKNESSQHSQGQDEMVIVRRKKKSNKKIKYKNMQIAENQNRRIKANRLLSKHKEGLDFNPIFQVLWQILMKRKDICRAQFSVNGSSQDDTKDGITPVRIDLYINREILNEFSNTKYGLYHQLVKECSKYDKLIQICKKNKKKYQTQLNEYVKKYFGCNESQIKRHVDLLHRVNWIYKTSGKLQQVGDQNKDIVNKLKKGTVDGVFNKYFEKIQNLNIQVQKLRYQKDQVQKIMENDRIIRLFLMHLMELMKVKKINRSFIKPKPKMNSFIRFMKRLCIGINQKRNEEQWIHKYRWFMKKFIYSPQLKMCVVNKSDEKYYKDRCEDYIKCWDIPEYKSKEYQSFRSYQALKIQLKNKNNENQQFIQKQSHKIEQLLGVSKSQSQQTNQEIEDQNQKLMKQFQQENKHFISHPTPQIMKSQLKYYQGQALSWMKYREGKITVEQLFDPSYIEEAQQFEFQRKLSPFWEEIQLLNGEVIYINYITGQMTKQFNEWKSVQGGILADEMGLGKTVMSISLMADDKFEGINLVVVPVNVLRQWKQQLRVHLHEQIEVYQYHGNINKRKQDLSDYKVIITTYATLSHEYKKYSQRQQNPQGEKFLFDYQFRRVFLDQAHNIKNTDTLQFEAAMQIKATYKWCLTGTLIQNNEQDLFAIFKFLNVEVFSQQHYWNQYIKNSVYQEQKLNVIHTVLRPIVLRRTKQSTNLEGNAILTLPKKIQITIRPKFFQHQAQIYQNLKNGIKQYFMSNQSQAASYTHVFQIICRLRQFCCHPSLIFNTDAFNISQDDIKQKLTLFLSGGVKGQDHRKQALGAMLESQAQTCVICLEQAHNKATITTCGHFYCQDCIKRQIKLYRQCAICRVPLNEGSFITKQKIPNKNISKMVDVKQNSKMKAIFQVMMQIRDRKEKCVVFSQFLKVIDLIRQFADNKQIKYSCITGEMNKVERARAVQKFKQKQSYTFMIVSIRAGGTGLNLTVANNVLICDPWWNPAHEDQAADRVHRIGQTKTVNVYRFIMRDSIQQKIEQMHKGKRKLANEVLMKVTKSNENDIKSADDLIKMVL